MLSSIWQCSPTSLTESPPDSYFFEALKLIDSHLGTVLEEDGAWQANLAPYENDTQSEQTFYKVSQVCCSPHKFAGKSLCLQQP